MSCRERLAKMRAVVGFESGEEMISLESGKIGAGRTARGLAMVTAALLLSTAAACSSPEEKVEKYTESGLEYLEKGDLGRANVQFQNALKIDETHVPALEGVVQITEERQDFNAMFGALQRIVRLDPENIDALVKIGKLYLIGSDETAALESADKALALSPEDPDALALKGAVLLKLDDEAGAVEHARRALGVEPGNTEAVAVLAAERSLAKDFEGALAIVDNALEADEKSSILHILRLQLLANLDRKDELRAGFKNLIELYPDNVSYRQMYSNALLQEKRYDDARKQLVAIAELTPDKVEPVLDVVRLDYQTDGAEAATKTFKSYVDERSDDIELRFTFGHYLRQEGDIAGAEAIYAGLAADKSDSATYLRARNEIAAVRLLQGKRDEAKAIIEEILKADSGNPDALLKQAGLKIDEKDYDGAIADLRIVSANKPDLAAAKVLMASAFEGKGDIEFARSQLAEAVAASKNSPDTSRVFARFLMRHGDNARAEQVLLDSLSVNARDLENLKLLAALRLARQDWRGAEEIAKLIDEAGKDDEAANRILGVARTGLQDYAGAIEALGAANRKTPLAARPLATLVSAYVKEGRASEAEEMLKDMVSANPQNYPARILLAQVLNAEKRTDEVEETLKEALEADPSRPEAAEGLYRLYLSTGRRDEAEAMLDTAIAKAPDVDAFKVLRGDLLITTGRLDEAIDTYADILSRRPGDLLVSNNYASLMLERRDDSQSLAKALDVARALEGSDNPYFLDTLGWAHYRNGDAESAIPFLESAIERAPNFAEAMYHLGAAYLAVGETEKARANLEKAIGIAPKTNFAEKARALLADAQD